METKIGNWKIKKNGSTKGHNGIKSIIGSLKNNEFQRILIGIDRPVSRDPEDIAEYVLSNFSSQEKQTLYEVTFLNILKSLTGN